MSVNTNPNTHARFIHDEMMREDRQARTIQDLQRQVRVLAKEVSTRRQIGPFLTAEHNKIISRAVDGNAGAAAAVAAAGGK